VSTANLRIEVRTGEAQRKQVEFAPGTVAEPFSVGSSGGWVISAPGIADVHAYLYYDGTTLFVARVGSASVTMAGHEIPEGWVPVEVPMNIHFAGAKLAVRGPTFKPRADAVPRALPHGDPTHADFQAVAAPVRRGPDGTIVEETARNLGARPPLDVPVDSEKTVVQNRADVEGPPGASFGEPMPVSEHTRYQPVGAPLPAAGQPPMHYASAASSSGPSSEATVMQPLEHYVRPESVTREAPMIGAPQTSPNEITASAAVRALPQAAPLPPMAPVPGVSVPGAPPVPYSLAVPPAAGPGATGAAQKAGAALAKVREALAPALAAAKKSWNEASIPQRIILVLLPFGFAAIFIVFKSPAPPPHVRGAVSGAASGSADLATSGSAPATSQKVPAQPPAPPADSASHTHEPQPPSEPEEEKSAKVEHGQKTPARLAADALVEGDYGAALRDYQALAAANPSNAAYKEAVRILERKVKQ
jgi:hypothetical protein